LPDGIIPSCNFISEIFIKALRKIGVEADFSARAEMLSAGARRNDRGERDICFVRPTKYEVVCGGKKLLGSAQKRGKHSLLQHGSLVLEPPLAVFGEFIDMAKLNQISVQECIGDRAEYSYKELAEIIGAEFSALFL
jgi:lipoate-protein ligase A